MVHNSRDFLQSNVFFVIDVLYMCKLKLFLGGVLMKYVKQAGSLSGESVLKSNLFS